MQTWLGGGTEEFAVKLGWRYGETVHNKVTAAYLLDIVIGGKSFIATFPFYKRFGLEGHTTGSPVDNFSVTVEPANLLGTNI